MRHPKTHPERATQWQRGILARRPVKVAVLAQAAQNVRIAWAMLQSGARYQTPDGATVGQAPATATDEDVAAAAN
jgi:transposase